MSDAHGASMHDSSPACRAVSKPSGSIRKNLTFSQEPFTACASSPYPLSTLTGSRVGIAWTSVAARDCARAPAGRAPVKYQSRYRILHRETGRNLTRSGLRICGEVLKSQNCTVHQYD